MTVRLTDDDRSMLAGERGDAAGMAMRVVVAMAEAVGAPRLIDIASAHIDGCLYHGPAGLDFAERLAAGGGVVRVPTTLNVSALDLLHPDLVRLREPMRAEARRQMVAYEQMGCQPTWTCAPYQLPVRPAFGEHICWAESNAIVFANTVLGARTDRYGDFIDICAALTGRVAEAGLHLDENRRGGMVFEVRGLRDEAFDEEALFALLGHVVGLRTGSVVPVITGVPGGRTEDQLKAFGAAAASAGAVAMAHIVGVTPEASSLAAALGGRVPIAMHVIGPDEVRAATAELTTATDGPLRTVSLGTPHLSLAGFERLAHLLDGSTIHPEVTLYVATGRDVLATAEARGLTAVLAQPNAQVVVDTCTYITPILRSDGLAMTDSAKWAWYAPGNLGVSVAFGTMEDCVRSAVEGRVVRDFGWLDG